MDLRPDLATHTLRLGLPDFNSNLTVNAALTDHDAAPNNLDINGGTTTLTANNTYSGTTTIANGTLMIMNANALGTASGTDADSTIINANGILQLNGNITLANEKITVNAGGSLAANNNSTAIYANPITMNGGTLGNAAYTGTISGTSDFNVGGGAVLAGTGLYSGNITLIGNATVTNASALNASSTTTVEFGAVLRLFQPVFSPLQIRDGTLFLGAGVTLTTAPITVLAGTLSAANSTGTYANPITIAGNATLAGGTFTGQLNGVANFTASGATLAGTGNYTGTLTISGPTTIAGPNALSAAGTNIITAGNVTVSAAVSAPFQITGGNVTLTAAVGGPINLSNGTIILANNASVASPITISKGQFIGNGTFTSALTITGTANLGAGNFSGNPSSLSFNGGLVGDGNVFISDEVVSGDTTPHFIISGTSAINNLQLSAGSFEFAGSTTVNGSTNFSGGFSIFTGSAHFVGPFTANSSNGSMQSGIFDSAVTLNNSSFAFSGTNVFHGPLTFTGSGRTITFAGATTFDLPLTVSAQTILFQNDTTPPRPLLSRWHIDHRP
jgi:fibronectin-binding autotransporter adhesin